MYNTPFCYMFFKKKGYKCKVCGEEGSEFNCIYHGVCEECLREINGF